MGKSRAYSICRNPAYHFFQANDNSGYIGAAIVGAFVIIVAGWYGGRQAIRKYRESSRAVLE